MAPTVTTRRALLGAGALVVAAGVGTHLAGVDDDLLRSAGVRPHPEPDPADEELLAQVVARQRRLVAGLDSLAARRPSLDDDVPSVRGAAREQLRTIGGRPGGAAEPVSSASEAARRFSVAARESTRAALAATSPDLARVLASLGAGQAQIARSLGRLS